MKTVIKKKETGEFNLYRGKIELLCPFRNPIVMPGRVVGQFQIANSVCSSNCPHFSYKSTHDGSNHTITVSLSCGSGTKIECLDKDTLA